METGPSCTQSYWNRGSGSATEQLDVELLSILWIAPPPVGSDMEGTLESWLAVEDLEPDTSPPVLLSLCEGSDGGAAEEDEPLAAAPEEDEEAFSGLSLAILVLKNIQC